MIGFQRLTYILSIQGSLESCADANDVRIALKVHHLPLALLALDLDEAGHVILELVLLDRQQTVCSLLEHWGLTDWLFRNRPDW